MALALVEAGCRVVYAADLPKTPSDTFQKTQAWANRLKGTGGAARLEYVSVDVTKQVCNFSS